MSTDERNQRGITMSTRGSIMSLVMFNHTKVSNNDVHAFRRIPCWQSGVAVQSAKHSEQRLWFTCSHFREIIYVEALLPRPHMPGPRGGAQLPFAGLPEGNQSQRSGVGRRGARGRRRTKPSVDRECWKRPDERKRFPKIDIVFCAVIRVRLRYRSH
jgi:hypothetical protein